MHGLYVVLMQVHTVLVRMFVYLRCLEPATPEGYPGVHVVHMWGSGNGKPQARRRTIVDLRTYIHTYVHTPRSTYCTAGVYSDKHMQLVANFIVNTHTRTSMYTVDTLGPAYNVHCTV